MSQELVDVAINVLGKPAQTTLALVSLLRHSGHRIDKVFFIEENNPINDNYAHSALLDMLGERVLRFRPRLCNWRYPMDAGRIGDKSYRHALRYQYAFERTDKRLLLLIHNDCEFVGDAVGLLQAAMEGQAGAGEIGQCHLCPAMHLGRCGPGRYREYRPDFEELRGLYAALDPAIYRRRYLDEPREDLRKRPWPLPECRLNEFCCLIDVPATLPLTMPLGPAVPFGAYLDLGNPETGNGVLDIGVAWFRDMVHLGMSFAHVPLAKVVRHDVGWTSLFDEELYTRREQRALDILAAKYS